MVNLIITIVVGAIIGWVAGIIMKDQGSLLAPRGLILGLACEIAVACLLIYLCKKIFK